MFAFYVGRSIVNLIVDLSDCHWLSKCASGKYVSVLGVRSIRENKDRMNSMDL